MDDIRWVVGVDVSTQTVTATLIGVMRRDGRPAEAIVSSAWTASRPCRAEADRKTPAIWVRLIRECVDDLTLAARETLQVSAIGVSTTFPGIFAIPKYGPIGPDLVSLYDNTDDAGVSGELFDGLLADAESETLNRMWPGNMAIGLAHLAGSGSLSLDGTAALVPPNSAFAFGLLAEAEHSPDPKSLFSDLTESVISGLYHSRIGQAVPPAVGALLRAAVPGLDADRVRRLLPPVQPAWRNVVPPHALPAVRDLLGLPNLSSVSIGAGDSPLGALALYTDRDTVINVRGSSDSPMIIVDAPRERRTPRETVLHYPMPTAESLSDQPWCVVAPMLRSGRVWDWVRSLRFPEGGPGADSELEEMAKAALKRRMRARKGSLESRSLAFVPALGGERAPGWDPRATGSIEGLLESHDLGDIALAALEGMSAALSRCIALMEQRYDVRPSKLLLAGGPTRNRLWNWVTQAFAGKATLATTFSDASLLGAAMLGYAADRARSQSDDRVSEDLLQLSHLVSGHPLIKPTPVEPPDEELMEMQRDYANAAAEKLSN